MIKYKLTTYYPTKLHTFVIIFYVLTVRFNNKYKKQFELNKILQVSCEQREYIY